jgi:hypothetical protein
MYDLQRSQEIREEECRRFRRIERIKKLIESIMGDRFQAVIEDFDNCFIWQASLTKQAPAEKYLEEEYLRKYVEQHCNCGCEDSYAGTIWYHLKDKHWVALEFNC